MDVLDYAALTQETVIDAVEAQGYLSDLRVFPLNSYENRVYQVGIEDSVPIIAKFYRPHRWTNEQIQEELTFVEQLQQNDVAVIAPLIKNNAALYTHKDYRFSLYPRRGGHAPDLDDFDLLYRLGQQIGRIHAQGASTPFRFRPAIDVERFAVNAREGILNSQALPSSLVEAYSRISEQLIEKLRHYFGQVTYTPIALHGDCHPGNILSRDERLHIVDFDDARNGPAMQDLWMFLSGSIDHQRSQLSALIEGYDEFYEFEPKQCLLIEPLRAMRQMHYANWLTQRRFDPAFKLAFPWLNTERYWSQHILELKEQFSALDEPALRLQP